MLQQFCWHTDLKCSKLMYNEQIFSKSADILPKKLGFFTSVCNKKWQTQKWNYCSNKDIPTIYLALDRGYESTFIFSISWHPAEIWEKKMQKLMLHWNFVKVICVSCKTKFKTIIIYEISWHLAEKTEISSFLHWKVCWKIFLPNSM